MIRFRNTSAFALFLVFLLLNSVYAEEAGFEIEICMFELPEIVKHANASFHLNYRFEVDENGEICNIEKVRDDYVGEEAVKSCLKSWKLRDFIGLNKQLNLIMFWKHGIGWTSLHFGSKELSYTIRIPKSFKQY